MHAMRTSSAGTAGDCAGSGAPKSPANYCTISCTIPGSGGWLGGIIRQFLQTRCDEASAELPWETSEFLAESAQVTDRKTVAPEVEMFKQVLILCILGVCGEVAEWPKAAVC